MTRDEMRQRRQQMAEMFRETQNYGLVSRHFGVSKMTVYNACHEFGIRRTHPRRRMTLTPQIPARRSLLIIADIIQTGDTFADIAAKHQVSNQWVSLMARQCHEAGIRFHPRPGIFGLLYNPPKQQGDVDAV
jgi:transposase-like protein